MASPPLPLMQQPRVQRVVYPALVALVVLGAWQALVVGMKLPPYLVPSPARWCRPCSPTGCSWAARCW